MSVIYLKHEINKVNDKNFSNNKLIKPVPVNFAMMNELIPVTLTKKAAEEVQKIMSSKNIPAGYGLRVGIKGSGGCSGFNYLIGFDKKKESDQEYTIKGIPLYIEKKHTMYLLDLEIDFYEGADARGFSFSKKGN